MLLRFENATLYTYFLVMVLILLSSSFGSLNAIELPLELLHDGVNIPKSTDYARRMAFPLATSADVVEMPLNVKDNMDFSSNAGNAGDENDVMDDDLTTRNEMPKWLQLQMLQEHHQQQQHLQTDHINYRNPMQQQQKHLNHHHSHHQAHGSATSSSSVSPLKRCSIEISSKIPGICQSMGSIGNACVSGDYIDVFNAECL